MRINKIIKKLKKYSLIDISFVFRVLCYVNFWRRSIIRPLSNVFPKILVQMPRIAITTAFGTSIY